MGKDGDFAGAEKLLEDFKARAEGIEDKSLLEEQMKYLVCLPLLSRAMLANTCAREVMQSILFSSKVLIWRSWSE